MKNIFFAFYCFCLTLASCGEGNKQAGNQTRDTLGVDNSTVDSLFTDEMLTAVIKGFVQGYLHQSNQEINEFVHPDLGLTVIYRPGVSDTFVRMDSMDFAKPMPAYYPYPSLLAADSLRYEKLPIFSCATEKWDKNGLFCDTLSTPMQLTQIALFDNEFNNSAFSPAQLQQIKQGELASYRVILTSDSPLVFHVQKYQGKWFVTVLDRAYAGCDA